MKEATDSVTTFFTVFPTTRIRYQILKINRGYIRIFLEQSFNFLISTSPNNYK